jgi:F-type H+-transporting ATPase subunit b
MVSLNATIFVLLAMFLGFLWLMHRAVFKPLLAHMDARSAQVAEDKRLAAEAASEADQLEDTYNSKVALIHREANLRIVKAQRQAQEAHLAKVTEYRARAEAEIEALAQSLAEDIAAQEGSLAPLADEFKAAMANKLALE